MLFKIRYLFDWWELISDPVDFFKSLLLRIVSRYLLQCPTAAI